MTVLQAVYNGERIQVLDTEKLAEFKRSCVKGRMIAMTLSYWEDARSRAQQGLAHEMLGRYARATGTAMQVIKDRIKYELGHWIPLHRIESGDVDPPSWRGKIIDVHRIDSTARVHLDLSLILLRSEADYTVTMERDLIDRVIYECQENDVDIEDILHTLLELNKEGKK